jgi:hypothetical protein
MMKPGERQSIEKHMESLDDHALLRVVAVESGEYTPDAIEIATAELQRRRLQPLNQEAYLEEFPTERIQANGFCAKCSSETTDESPGFVGSIYFVGTRLIGRDIQCATCHATLQTLWFCLIIPLFPLGRFRVIYLGHGFMSSRFIARKVRTD